MNLTFSDEEESLSDNRSILPHFYRLIGRFSPPKTPGYVRVLELCLLVLIFLEHGLIFIFTCRRRRSSREPSEANARSILLPSKSCLYSCLHRNWIRVFSFSNLSLSLTYSLLLMLKHYYPNLVHHSSITFCSLPLNLVEQILLNFSSFHLLVIAISVGQYFLRHDRLVKNTFSVYFFNGQNRLLNRHSNVALILSGSLALILAYNFIFYTPKYPHTITLLPLVTFNMILLPAINLLIFSFICSYFLIRLCAKKDFSLNNEHETLRFIIEKNSCVKCYAKILQRNAHLFQDKDHQYINLQRKFSFKRLCSAYPFVGRDNRFSSPDDHELNNASPAHQFLQTTLMKLRRQHVLCHRAHHLLLIFLLKYILFTSPQYILQMLVYVKQFAESFFKWRILSEVNYSLQDTTDTWVMLCHQLFLLSRLGDSVLLTRLPALMKKYFPCWCQFNSKCLRRAQISHQILTTKFSDSSANETQPNGDGSLPTEPVHVPSPRRPRRLRLRFAYVPLWSNHRPRVFQENQI